MAKDADVCGVDPVTGRLLETEAIRTQGLADLRQAIAVAGHTPIRSDDQYYLPFLRARKYRVKDALLVLQNFDSLWRRNSALIDGLCAARVQPWVDMGVTQTLPGKDAWGCSIAAIYMGKMLEDPAKLDPKLQLAYTLLVTVGLFEDEEMQLCGVSYVESLTGFSMGKAMKLAGVVKTPESIELNKLMTDTVPLRVRRIYVCDAPWYFGLFWGMVRPFLPSKLASKVMMVKKDRSNLFPFIAAELLPPIFGGTAVLGTREVAMEKLVEAEAAGTKVGGFVVPLNAEHPCGTAV